MYCICIVSTIVVAFEINIYLSIDTNFLLTSFSLPFSELSLVGLALDMAD